MLGLELVVVLGLAVLLCGVLAQRLRVSPSILQLTAGALLGFLPALRAVQFPPEVVLLLFLPVLLYWESLNTSLRYIRRSLRGVVLVSTLLVIATAGAVASVAHAFGMPWGRPGCSARPSPPPMPPRSPRSNGSCRTATSRSSRLRA